MQQLWSETIAKKKKIFQDIYNLADILSQSQCVYTTDTRIPLFIKSQGVHITIVMEITLLEFEWGQKEIFMESESWWNIHYWNGPTPLLHQTCMLFGSLAITDISCYDDISEMVPFSIRFVCSLAHQGLLTFHHVHGIITSQNGDAFCITGSLWGK